MAAFLAPRLSVGEQGRGNRERPTCLAAAAGLPATVGPLPAASLTKRFLLTLLLSAAVPLVAFGWFAVAGMRRQMEERIGDVYLPQLAHDAAAAVAQHIDQTRTRLALLVLPAANLLADPSKRRDFEDQARLLPGVNEDFDLLLLAAASGEILLAHYNPRLDPATRSAREALRPPRLDTDWFRSLASGAGEVWVDRHLSPLLHRATDRVSRDPADHHVGLGLPVRGGVLYALVRWDRVQGVIDRAVRFLRDADEGGLPSAQCFVIDPRGLLLAHTDRSRYSETLHPDGVRNVLAAQRAKMTFVDRDGHARRGGAARVEGLPPSLRWWLGLHVREAELFASSNRFARLLTGAMLLLVGILALWSVVAARAIARPVRDLAAATRRLAAGDLAARVQPAGPGELAALADAFNQMTDELQRSREQLRAAERQAAWAEMARQIAHEIKNPLTPMRMSAQLLQRARRDGDPRAGELSDRLARTVLDQTDALARIAADFRQFAGPARRQRERVPVDGLLADLARFFGDLAAARGVVLSVGPSPPELTVHGDRQELGRALVNLVQNAIEAGGRRVEVTASRAPGGVVFTVADDGPGVPADVQARLFEPYFTTKTSGTGLGLAICRRVVDAHGGEVSLRSSRAGETVFSIRLPECAATPADSAAPGRPA
jgi:signal transduction histidine kinase